MPDDEDIVAGLAFGDDRFACGHRHHLGRVERLGQVGGGQARSEHLQQLPLETDAGDRAVGTRRGLHEFERSVARHFNQDSVIGRADGGTAATTRDQADFAENGARR